jgi:hypothetical protein
LAGRDGGIRLGALDIATRRFCPRFHGSIDATDPSHSAARTSRVRHVGPTGSATVTGATTERSRLCAGHPAVRTATEKLRVRGQHHKQDSCECSTRQQMIRLHGRLLLRPRSFRDLSKEYYVWAATNLPPRFVLT